MRITDVYLALAALAKETIRDYASDFYQHDARVLFDMKPGDIAIWAPRESGSCLVIVARQLIGNDRALESFRAYRNTFPNLQWQVIDSNVHGDWSVAPIDTPEALIREYQEYAEQYKASCKASGAEPRLAVSELHM
jgi:hypothetical protein